jgi:uncharacterized cupin superfamily protein
MSAQIHEPGAGIRTIDSPAALTLQVGDDHRIALPGTFVGIPAGVAHTMCVAGDEPVRMLMTLSNPERAIQMLDTLEQVFADGEPDPERAGDLLAKIDMEVLAPV